MKEGAVIYCRVSTEEQAEKFSLGEQLTTCRKKALDIGCPVIGEFVEEGVSGVLLERPKMKEMMQFCADKKDDIQYIIVKSLDRFSRDMQVHLSLKSYFRGLGIELYSVGQPIEQRGPTGDFIENIFSGIAQLERATIMERTMVGVKEVVKRGGWVVKPPFGYSACRVGDNLPSLKVNEEEAVAVRAVYREYARGGTLKSCADLLNDMGVRGPHGKDVNMQSIRNWLLNPAYRGIVKHNAFPDEEFDGLHEAIVDKGLWETVQRRLAGRKIVSRRTDNQRFPLSGFLKCSKCGSLMTGSTSRGRNGDTYDYYHCRKKRCRSKNLPKKGVEEGFISCLNELSVTEDGVDMLEKGIESVKNTVLHDGKREKIRLQTRKNELLERVDRIDTMLIDGEIERETAIKQKQMAMQDLCDINHRLDSALENIEDVKGAMVFVRGLMTNLGETWLLSPYKAKKLLQKFVFPEGVTVLPNFEYRTSRTSVVLALSRAAKKGKLNLAALIGTSWNHLRLEIQFLAQVSASGMFPTLQG